MSPPISIRFVIDSSVMQASGGWSPHDETPIRCKRFLQAVRANGHRVVLTDLIEREWKQGRHMSTFARKWLVSMTSRRLIARLEQTARESLRIGIESLDVRPADLRRMLEDLFLIKAALAADHIVVSLDEEARRLFHAAAKHIRELEPIIWVNAGNPAEEAAGWVNAGVSVEPQMTFGGR